MSGPVVLEEGCAWTSDQVGDDYVWELTDADRAELDAALEHAEARTERTLDITVDDFPLPTLGPKLDGRRPRAHRRARRGAHPRRARRSARPRPRVGRVLGDGRPPRAALAAEPQGPPARRRHRPGQVRLRPHQPRQRDRRRGVPVPLRRLRPRRALLPRRRRQRRRQPRGQRRVDPQRARAHRPRPGRRALRALRLRHARRGEAGEQALVPDAGVHAEGAPALHPLHPALHPLGPPSPRRAGPVGGRHRGDGPGRRHVRRPDVPPLDAAAPRRHAVREQLPRAPRARRLHGRPTQRDRCATSSACGSRPACSPTTTSPTPSGSVPPPTRGGRRRGGKRPRRPDAPRRWTPSPAPRTSSPSTVPASRCSPRTRGTSARPGSSSRSASRRCAPRAAAPPSTLGRPRRIDGAARRPSPAPVPSRPPSTCP